MANHLLNMLMGDVSALQTPESNEITQRASQMTHEAVQSPYGKFQQEYPQLDAYGRKVASGRQFKETMGTLADALNNTSGQLIEGKADTGAGNIMDYMGFGAMTAFHGSPHKFDKFSMDNIGTGEGAQAYGHGLYFAENKDVAGSYKQALSPMREIEINGERFDIRDMATKTTPEGYAASSMAQDARFAPKGKMREIEAASPDVFVGGQKEKDKILEGLQSFIDKKAKQVSGGNMYEVDIPDEHIKNFLDWDKYLDKQSKPVQDAYKEFATSADGIEYAKRYTGYKEGDTLLDIEGFDNPIGETLNNVLGNADNQATLKKHGVKGIKYFDGSSRSAGEGTRNLVVFDDSIINTLKRNNEDILPEMLKPQAEAGALDPLGDGSIPYMLKNQN